jgi:hypothetical protein
MDDLWRPRGACFPTAAPAARPHHLGCGGPARPDADASDERIVELRDRPANTRTAYERDYGRFRAFIGSRSLRAVGLGDLSDFAATLTGSAATRTTDALGDQSVAVHRFRDGGAAV